MEVALLNKAFKIHCALIALRLIAQFYTLTLILFHFFRLIAQFYTLTLILFHFDRNIDKCRPSLADCLLYCQKMRYLHCVVKFKLRKLGCALTWYENAVPQLRNCVALQLNQKAHCGSCAALQKLKKNKLRILRCAFTG